MLLVTLGLAEGARRHPKLQMVMTDVSRWPRLHQVCLSVAFRWTRVGAPSPALGVAADSVTPSPLCRVSLMGRWSTLLLAAGPWLLGDFVCTSLGRQFLVSQLSARSCDSPFIGGGLPLVDGRPSWPSLDL